MFELCIMKKIVGFILLILCLSACATMQMRQEPTLLMSSPQKIQYYQEQISRYNYLIEQEQNKIEATK